MRCRQKWGFRLRVINLLQMRQGSTASVSFPGRREGGLMEKPFAEHQAIIDGVRGEKTFS
jgi:hypothetical protein